MFSLKSLEITIQNLKVLRYFAVTMIAVEIIKIEQIPNKTKATDFFFNNSKIGRI